jgi:prepilin-type N-terminal cleavage/methylation domain-containing protein
MRRESGMSMVELMIAMTVLAVGIAGILGLVLLAMISDNRNKHDTTATMVAQAIVEQVQAVPASSTATIPVTDCSGAVFNVGLGNVAVGAVGANLTAAGAIDWTQAQGAVAANYAATYNACGPNNQWVPYAVRWNVQTLYAGPAGPYVKIVTVSARPMSANTVGNFSTRDWALPVTMRTVVGM